MSIQSSYIWMDGEMVPFENATTHILSHSLHYGLGVFEGIRSYDQVGGGGGIFKLEEHIRRLLDSAKMCRMDVPYSLEDIRQACLDTLIKNEFESAYIRPLIYLGMGGMGLGARNNPVHVSIIVWKWGAYLGDEGIQNGIRVATSSFTRHHVNANLQRAKITGHYVNSIMARYEANDNGYDEAVMLDHSGYVAEGTGENLFIIRDGVVKTPPVQNILGGITRKTAIQILENEGLKVHEMLFGRDALYISDEIFMTGTAAEITPIREVDRRVVGPPGPITKMVQETYVNGVRGQVDWMKPFITTY
ncbi:MAG: branched-chain amino acid transaminase [Myxococcota bacterium]